MTVEGTVFRVNSGNYHVQTEEHGVVICKLRGNLKKELVYSTSGSRAKRVETAKKRRDTDPIAVGERVEIDPDLLMIEGIPAPPHRARARVAVAARPAYSCRESGPSFLSPAPPWSRSPIPGCSTAF